MGGPRKKQRKFQYNVNRRKLWLKSKKLPQIQCEQIKKAWDENKSVTYNLRAMGLASNPNEAIPVPKTKNLLGDIEVAPVPKMHQQTRKGHKSHVADELEAESKIPTQRRVRLSEPEVKYCVHMIEKYGEDYKAMTRDAKNYYQETPKQIRRKIMTFKSIPEQYNAYLNSKQQTSDDTTT